MALQGPRLHSIRIQDAEGEDLLPRALRLARELEELLEPTRSSRAGSAANDADATHSTRMARALAASLVDELQAVTRGGAKRSMI